MSINAKIKEARKNAGLIIPAAAMKTYYSESGISRRERGRVVVKPEDVIIYAKAYRQPELLTYYCRECPINKAMRLEGVRNEPNSQAENKIWGE